MSQTSVRLEYAGLRRLRDRNKVLYRIAHWPIWITVFYLIPGPITFRMFATGIEGRMGIWLAVVLVGTGLAGLFGQLPGVEPRPYIIRFTEDKPNPMYRRICYTIAWSELIAYTSVNLAGIVVACMTGKWRLVEFYRRGYLPIVVTVWTLGALGRLPRVNVSTKGEGDERRYFYGTMWAAPLAQVIVWILWRTVPVNRTTNWVKLGAFAGVLAGVGSLAVRGLLPRTRKIVAGEFAISD